MKKRTYKTLAGLLRANGEQQFTMSDFLGGQIYDNKHYKWRPFELTDNALRELSDGKTWWCVWDRQKQAFSSFVCHGKYRTKSLCELRIAYHNKAWNLPHILN